MNRYRDDVLSPGWQHAGKPKTVPLPVSLGLVVEDPTSGFVGAIVRWENGLVVLEDRRGKQRAFPFGPGFWVDGKPVELTGPVRAVNRPTHTASGSRIGKVTPAKVAAASRIFVEGKHDAELVEKIWGDDLRHVGVVVEMLDGIDHLAEIVAQFRPTPTRRLGVLVDHLLPGTKEHRIATSIKSDDVFITGHEYVDIWQAIKPEVVGIADWPVVPRGQDIKVGTCQALGWPHQTANDLGRVWAAILGKVSSWSDLDRRLVTEVERLIDFVTA